MTEVGLDHPKDNDPLIVHSDRSGPFEKDGHVVEVHIYTLEGEQEWSLEVVDEKGTSTVWDEIFKSDKAAWRALLDTGPAVTAAKVVPINAGR